jgi:hypothetical protein
MSWSYYGLHRSADGWEQVSGYVPNDGHDTEEAARDAAEMLGAERVALWNERWELVSLRDHDGERIEGPAPRPRPFPSAEPAHPAGA